MGSGSDPLESAAGGGGGGDATTIFVKGFDASIGEDAVRSALEQAFGECGDVSAVRLPSDRNTGELKGIAFVQFASAEAKVGFATVLTERTTHPNFLETFAHVALVLQDASSKLDGAEVAGGTLFIDPNTSRGPDSGRGGGRSGGRGGGRGFGRGGRDGGPLY